MYENQTYEIILRRMIAKVEEWARNRSVTLDTREGSIIRTALSPAAMEMAQMYVELDQILNESFADTQSRTFLIERCRERGINVELATPAIRKGVFNIDIPLESRFSLNKINYFALEKIANGEYKMQCETAGDIGNRDSGNLIPIDYINGLTSAVLTDVLIPGEDDETTEHLRQRYFDSLESQAFGGNIADYKDKVGKINGVGGVKVYPAWNGGGTVKIVFVDSLYQKPSGTLVDDVQSMIDPEENQGLGMGFAPIGHTVTVEGADENTIDILTSMTFQDGWDWESVKPYVESVLDEYFTELSSEWAASDTTVVRISQIETRILGITGVIDIADTEINGASANLVLGEDEIAIRGTINVRP